ncbi:MAG: prolyl oligopeptidase family serine peptidase [Verrucomicrobia bacterium]|nr:prolyl oligopeptidase family serine peptidase [Verrucomicrobiota bacterium]
MTSQRLGAPLTEGSAATGRSPRHRVWAGILGLFFFLVPTAHCASWDDWPALPPTNGTVELPAQEWRFQPGPRTVRVRVKYPEGRLDRLTPETGMMLTLHNWGGTDCVGTADPEVLAWEFRVVTLCVNYLQSGPDSTHADSPPYDFGWLQSLDALRALAWLEQRLRERQLPFDAGRVFATGGSGGANVALMANKLAPRTFAGIVALSGMTRLTDDIAFNEPGGSPLNARWSRDSASANYLSEEQQFIRYVGYPLHLRQMKSWGTSAEVVVIHGVDDPTCPVADARDLVAQFQAVGLKIRGVWVDTSQLNGAPFRSSDHALGDRTEIVRSVAGAGLRPGTAESWRRSGPSDFQRREDLKFLTYRGRFVISYRDGFPVGRWEPRGAGKQ